MEGLIRSILLTSNDILAAAVLIIHFSLLAYIALQNRQTAMRVHYVYCLLEL